MKFVDVTAKRDSMPDSSSKADYSLPWYLSVEDYEEKNYPLLTLNDFVLDGSKEVKEEHEFVAFLSMETSDGNGNLGENVGFWVDFIDPHTSAGITFHFNGDYPSEMSISWYGMNGTEIITKTFNPDSLTYFCKQQVTNYGYILVKFSKTRFPYQNVRVKIIDYGLTLNWGAGKIKTANVLEEVNSISTELSINTASVEILDENNDFDIGNEFGAWKSVQKTQEVTLTEYIDNVPVPIGTFYLDDKKFTSNIASFTMVDAIGLLDNYTFYEGTIYNRAFAGDVISDIFKTANIKKFEIDDDVYNVELSGWLGIQSCREALQMICCVCGAVADDSRSDTIRIYTVSRSVTATVPTSRKFNGKTSISLDAYVSGVQLECSKYALSTELSEIFNDFLPKGRQTITFSEPYLSSSLVSTGCTITNRGTNYVSVFVENDGECVISGQKYEESLFRYQLTKDIDAGEAENVIELGTFTLYNASMLPVIAKKMLDYYSLRKVVEMEYIVETEHAGNWINIVDSKRNQATSLIESQSIDLTGGFISTTKCRGYSTVVTELYYTGNYELYSGDNALI